MALVNHGIGSSSYRQGGHLGRVKQQIRHEFIHKLMSTRALTVQAGKYRARLGIRLCLYVFAFFSLGQLVLLPCFDKHHMRRSSSTKYRYKVFALMDSTGLLSTNRLARSQSAKSTRYDDFGI